MNQSDLVRLAKQYLISDAGLSRPNLIRTIQLAEGHSDCFMTGKTRCGEMTCRWRNDCMTNSAEPAQSGF